MKRWVVLAVMAAAVLHDVLFAGSPPQDLAFWGAVAAIGASYLKSKKAKKAAKKAGQNTERGIAEYDPAQIAEYMQQLYKHYYAQMNPAMQAAMGSFNARLGRTGGTNFGVAQQLKAGIPGQFANAALQQALPGAFQIAGARSGLMASKPVDSTSVLGDVLGAAVPYASMIPTSKKNWV